jgi:hypothetical protein
MRAVDHVVERDSATSTLDLLDRLLQRLSGRQLAFVSTVKASATGIPARRAAFATPTASCA